MQKYRLHILLASLVLAIFSGSLYAQASSKLSVGATILSGHQGGTGIGVAVAGDVGKFLKVTNNSPLTYGFDSVAGGSQTPWAGNINGATYSLSNVGSLSATSSLITQATSTNLAITGITSSLLKTNAGGSVVGATAGTDYVAPASLASYLTLSSWYATTTDGLAEGVSPSRLYFSNARAQSAMAGLYEVPLTFNYPLSRSVNAISMVATSSLNLLVGSFLSPNISQWTNDSGYTNYSYPFPNNATSSNLTFSGLSTFSSASTTGILTIHEICNEAGECWDSPTPAGNAVVFYPSNATADIATYEDMLSIPAQGSTIDESCTADADIAGGYCTVDTYVSTTTDVTITNYPAGTTIINAYTYSSASVGNTYLVFDGFRRTSAGAETWLGQATTSDINASTITDYSASFTGASDFAFSTNGTDRLVWKIRAWTDSVVGRDVHFTYQSTSHYSRMATPILIADRGYTKRFLNEPITGLWNFSGGLISNSSSTLAYFNSASSSIGTLAIPSLGSAIMLTNSNGVFAKYTGSTCTNQAVTAISAIGGATCTSLTSAYISGLDISADTNLAVTYPMVLTDDTLSLAFGTTTSNTWASSQTFSAILGAIDAGGATSFETVNGASPTVDAIGEIAIDTTDGDLLFATSTNASYPATVRSQPPLFRFKVASTSQAYASTTMDIPTDIRGFTLTGISCFVEGGTSVAVTFADANSANSTNSVTCSTTRPTTMTAFTANNVWTAGEELRTVWGTKTGAVDYVNITLYGFWTRT